MKKIFHLIIVLIPLSVLGCGGPGIWPLVEEPDRGLAFGYIDMEDAPSALNSASIYQVLPKTDKPYWSAAVEKGMFIHFLPNGTYQLTSFGGAPQGWRRFFSNVSYYNYNFPKYGQNQTAARITKQGVYFLGSFKLVIIPAKGFFGQESFKIEEIKSPTEKDLLGRFLEMKEIQGTRWEKIIKTRMAQMK